MSPRAFRRQWRPRKPGSRRPARNVRPVDGQSSQTATLSPDRSAIDLPSAISVKDLAERLGLSSVQVIKELMNNGVIANINQIIDRETAEIVVADLGFEVAEPESADETTEEAESPAAVRGRFFDEDEALVQPRPAVVAVLGHVDHGKTSLLDAVRQTNVTSGEAGGITQHIGAYQVVAHDSKLTFLDTPGHEAFTAMRARGAHVTDVAVLVVAADDGVMPQTREAIDHIKAAGVPMVVALNKMDRPNVNVDKVKQQLADSGVLPREYGGEVELVPVSARTGEGLDALLETILLVVEADVNPKANPDRPAIGVVIEAKMDRTRGPVATVLVQTGTLRVGEEVVVGSVVGKIKALFDDMGRRVKEAVPSTPVEVLGLETLPAAGDRLEAMSIGRARVQAEANKVVAQRDGARPVVSLEDIYLRIRAGQAKELNVIVKTDVQGSVEPIVTSLERLGQEDLRVKVIHAATGNVTESDVMLASASKAIVIGFSVRPDTGARESAEIQGVQIRYYDVIYKLVEDVEKALHGLLAPIIREVVQGHAEVRQVFRIGRAAAAGCFVRDGTITRNSLARIRRGNELLADTRVSTLRRFKDDAREVATGYECGIGLEGFNDFQEGDVIEAYVKE